MLNKILLSCLFSSVFAAQAWAEAGHEDTADLSHGQDGAHAASSGGLPQFDPTWFASQIFWLIAAFVILYVFFAKKTLPEISSVIENRKNHIQSDLEMAEKITAEADEVQDAYQKNLDRAQGDAAEAIKTVENKVKRKAEKAADDFKHKSDVALKETEKRIEDSKIAAMDDMNQIAVDAAAQAVEKIIGMAPDGGKTQAAVKSANKKISGKFQSDKAKAA